MSPRRIRSPTPTPAPPPTTTTTGDVPTVTLSFRGGRLGQEKEREGRGRVGSAPRISARIRSLRARSEEAGGKTSSRSSRRPNANASPQPRRSRVVAAHDVLPSDVVARYDLLLLSIDDERRSRSRRARAVDELHPLQVPRLHDVHDGITSLDDVVLRADEPVASPVLRGAQTGQAVARVVVIPPLPGLILQPAVRCLAAQEQPPLQRSRVERRRRRVPGV